ncbi:RagB/SusD family nutrient uptake outer membrane protein [Hymenobacter sp. PAMC 26628]|uniref:RagB/SusD family nutrient uptake outer membrane protein n=1 Tax=Hymenobacter sp. PAMC 26628 TaxID=1484118 RepID=UPI000770239A|nr:RagB/SusD family nutrient uptake outer membrane protein [Hymenobacter sp. PAMC 26628]AMJ64284.1 hypothetical protein AXW84_01675 [Hymenobacter sp. PAMC 26628]
MTNGLRRAGLWVGQGALGLALLAGCGAPAAPAYRIGFSQCSTNGPWRQAMRAGMERALSFHPEVLLAYAEAVNEQNGPTADALAKLNLVRQRAGLAALAPASPQAASKQALRNQIDLQRRLELAFDGERWFDLLRYARHTAADASATHAVTALDLIAQQRSGARNVNYLLFPLPQTELNTNPQGQQNPGY